MELAFGPCHPGWKPSHPNFIACPLKSRLGGRVTHRTFVNDYHRHAPKHTIVLLFIRLLPPSRSIGTTNISTIGVSEFAAFTSLEILSVVIIFLVKP